MLCRGVIRLIQTNLSIRLSWKYRLIHSVSFFLLCTCIKFQIEVCSFLLIITTMCIHVFWSATNRERLNILAMSMVFWLVNIHTRKFIETEGNEEHFGCRFSFKIRKSSFKLFVPIGRPRYENCQTHFQKFCNIIIVKVNAAKKLHVSSR